MANSPVDDAIADLKQRKRSMRCRELVSTLEELGFDVRDGSRGGHKVYTHMTNAHDYNITIRKAVIEGEALYEARIRELPDVTEYADTAEDAYALAIDTIETTAQILHERGKAMPAAYVPADEYSGRVTLRLPRSLHRALSEASETEGVSLNQHLVGILTYVSGISHGATNAPGPASSASRKRRI